MEIYFEGSLENERLSCPLNSAIVAYVTEFCEPSNYNLFTVDSADNKHFTVDALTVKTASEVPCAVRNCILPCLVSDDNYLIHAGLCSVLRKIVKTSGCHHILGHKNICLKACAEVSVWTKFCEVDFPKTATSLLTDGWSDERASDIMKLENHFCDPPIVANAGKHRRAAVERGEGDGGLRHLYAEGIAFTLTDVILFVCMSYILKKCSDGLRELPIPNVLQWYQRVAAIPKVRSTSEKCVIPIVDVSDLNPSTESLTKDFLHLNVREASRQKFKIRHQDVSATLLKMGSSEVICEDHPLKSEDGITLPWKELPLALNPSEGDLPASRTERKCQQLENLASAIVSIAKEGDVIVDFCAGGGHLGLLVAYLLPKCQVILVENKEESIERAVARVRKLGLTNILLYQMNLGYFQGDFTIGTCLHACGVATDLVLESCLSQRASFVVCPCCYGAIHNTHTLVYPRNIKSSLNYEEYLSLCHSSDMYNKSNQSTAKHCMEIIDADRLICAQQEDYSVTLCTLDPPSCSPKNNLLIGRSFLHRQMNK